MRQAFMRNRWYDLLFVHYALDPGVVRPLVTDGLELDTFPEPDGQKAAWVGLVLFRMTGVRPRWMPEVAAWSRFAETNVRTYVRTADGTPGVLFLSLDASNGFACRAARALYHLPYWHSRMSVEREGDSVRYASERVASGAGASASCVLGRALGEAAAGSLDYFLVERYLLFSRFAGRLFSARVHHAPYGLREARLEGWRETLTEALGLPVGLSPAHVCFCDGVDAEVFCPRPYRAV